MTHGTILGSGECSLRWSIPNFFTLDVKPSEYIDSPKFLIAGQMCHLRAFPRYLHFAASVHLLRDDPNIGRFIYSLGVCDKNGLEKRKSENRTLENGETNNLSASLLFSLKDLRELVGSSDTVIFTCRIDYNFSTEKKEENTPQAMIIDLEALSSGFEELMSSERTSDFTIEVQGKKFPTHKAVLWARSSDFRAMLRHDTDEAQSGILRIPDCDKGSFGEFLRFLYTGKLEDISFDTAYHLYTTSEKYDVQKLKTFCSDYLSRHLSIDIVLKVILLSDKYGRR